MPLIHSYLSFKYHIIAALSLLLVGCGKETGTSPAVLKPALPNAIGGLSYEIVTKTYPEDIAKYSAVAKGAYDLCVYTAQTMHLPVEPFVQIPNDFLIERQLYTSDGKSFYEKTESFDIDIALTLPETNCKTRIASSSAAQTIRDGFIYSVNVNEDGERYLTPPDKYDPDTYGAGHENFSAYNVTKLVNGITLDCLSDKDLTAQLMTSGTMCVFLGTNGNNPLTFSRTYCWLSS